MAARFPTITVNKWTIDGPVYTVEHRLSGRRHRRLRRMGMGPKELVGNDRMQPSDAPEAYLAWVIKQDQYWLFNKGHQYVVTLLVDGDEQDALLDARDEYVGQVYRHADGIELVDWKVYEGHDLDDEDAVEGDGGKSFEDEEE